MTIGCFLLCAMILISVCLIGFAIGMAKIYEDALRSFRGGYQPDGRNRLDISNPTGVTKPSTESMSTSRHVQI